MVRLAPREPPATDIAGTASASIEGLVYMGWINIVLKDTRGERIAHGDLFQLISQFFSFLVAYITYGVAVGAGPYLMNRRASGSSG